MKVRAHVYVSGMVQGVFYRSNTRDAAKRIGIMGWVRNLPDGNVEAVFEGEKEKVEAMIRWCRKGPSAARVDGVGVEWETPEEEDDFVVRYF